MSVCLNALQTFFYHFEMGQFSVWYQCPLKKTKQKTNIASVDRTENQSTFDITSFVIFWKCSCCAIYMWHNVLLWWKSVSFILIYTHTRGITQQHWLDLQMLCDEREGKKLNYSFYLSRFLWQTKTSDNMSLPFWYIGTVSKNQMGKKWRRKRNNSNQHWKHVYQKCKYIVRHRWFERI